MIYRHHGLDNCDFFNDEQIDVDALTFLTLVQKKKKRVVMFFAKSYVVGLSCCSSS
jgi:hypothetical protein